MKQRKPKGNGPSDYAKRGPRFGVQPASPVDDGDADAKTRHPEDTQIPPKTLLRGEKRPILKKR